MKITWTFYPKNQPSICLELIYEYRLDALKLDCGGVIDRNRNIAIVDWKTFSIFNKGENNEKKAAFARLADASDFTHAGVDKDLFLAINN
ncbi:hypothetical protein [Emticicia agri]|uniref:hypothetical protein n=1 Tax=Emticicia agri TaxID=2492393 RepID=UPI001A925203|nr:hypothetical protein [Emticicia agri]